MTTKKNTWGCSCGNKEITEVGYDVFFCPRLRCRVGWFTTDQLGPKSVKVYMSEEETDQLLRGEITQQQLIDKREDQK